MEQQKPRSMSDIRAGKAPNPQVITPQPPAKPASPPPPPAPAPRSKRKQPPVAAEVLPPADNLLDMPAPKLRRKGRVVGFLLGFLIVAATIAAGAYVYLKFFR